MTYEKDGVVDPVSLACEACPKEEVLKIYFCSRLRDYLSVICSLNKLVGTDTVQGICLSENIASKRVLRKCGFETVFEGVGDY